MHLLMTHPLFVDWLYRYGFLGLRIPVHREHSFRFTVNARSADAEHQVCSS